MGAVFLTGLFCLPGASLDVTEALSSRKYPAYERYQERVSRFFPWPPKSSTGVLDPIVIVWAVVGLGAAVSLQSLDLLTTPMRLSYGLP